MRRRGAPVLLLKGDLTDARARTATPPERARLWEQMIDIWPDYNAYQTKTHRETPVVVLEPHAAR